MLKLRKTFKNTQWVDQQSKLFKACVFESLLLAYTKVHITTHAIVFFFFFKLGSFIFDGVFTICGTFKTK